GEQRLQLPGAQIARRVVARIDVDKRVRARIDERRRAGEQLYVQIRQRLPAYVAAVQLRLVDQLGAVAPQEMQLLESARAQERPHRTGTQLRVALEPALVMHAMVEEHRVRF